MAGVVRLNVKDANELATAMENSGGNADSLRATINEVNDAKNSHSSVPATDIGDEEYLAEKREQSYFEHGTDLECMITMIS